ncbi:3-octaprenyl-4-hydroxybenzoate carboxy-lyase [Syntrophobotulus glycolicus DSM 8271]|uniref:Flavin prenyltransferase UbiX n=1 Tax=Syntrophobotulus glycolicus (strain DSM 8271 / FlGlyR) TaxID=645991 RepID=F0SYY3_SYNGF|nr:flavin prenyltransferase UbiX [Syntrophobotulus glycolicus]ADY56020.1 3-octaprenyl-4-hydroxybenzoate carboxy-lyase [Syntrophobotulus glycolicus DSM 8271]
MKNRFIVGITGASGSIYADKLIKVLVEKGYEVHVVLTETGLKVMEYECGRNALTFSAGVIVHSNQDLFAPIASGSFRSKGMVVLPSSMNTLGHIAGGTGDGLLSRAAQVMLKERRPFIVVPRETPYTIINIENMLRIAKAGGVILPASPGFYHHPESMGDLVDYIVGKILDILNIEHDLFQRWGEK